jgi:hypothetical protein
VERYSAGVLKSWSAPGLDFVGQASVPGFCAAAEVASPPSFDVSSAVARTPEGDVAAASPVFRTDYRVDTSLPLSLRRPIAWLERLAPRLVKLEVVGLGSPVMDRCTVGFRTNTSTADRANLFSALLDAIEEAAETTGADLLAVKDFGDRENRWAEPALGARGFARMASLPVAVLDLPFASVEEYLEALPGSVRRDVRRKVRQSAKTVRFTEASTVAGREQEIAQLYEETRANGAGYGNFDALSSNYVSSILQGVNGEATVLLGWVDNVLASFALILVGSDGAYAHQIGMRYPLARENNLYFLNWLEAVRFCVGRGIRRLEFGQTCYPLKLRLGCRLERSWIYVRHRVRPINTVFGYIAPKFGFDRMEPGVS